jgi:3-carboxy-cis,cis-muconate cycloisomerase
VAPSALVALCRHAQGLAQTLTLAGSPRQQRDGAAWFTEWLTLPPMMLALLGALEQARALVPALDPDAPAMSRALAAGGGSILAESLSFALAAHMPRPEAQEAVKALCRAAQESGETLEALARREHPALDPALFDPARHLGTAPRDARRFAEAAKARAG